VVGSPDHDDVHLHRVEPGGHRGPDAVDHPVELVAPGQFGEPVGAERIERHVDAPQARVDERLRQRRQARAVGGEGQIDPERREHPHQHRELGTDRGLTAGEADRVEPEPLDAGARHPFELLEREQLVSGVPVHALGGHAVGAAEVAPVGHRDAEVSVTASVAVDQRNGFRSGTTLLRLPIPCSHGRQATPPPHDSNP
jgi:hypothetical protein